MKDGIVPLSEGVTKLQEGSKTLKETTTALANGAGTLYEGIVVASTGIGTLNEGSNEIKVGLSTLNSGATELQASSKKLAEASGTISEGATSLAEGMTKFDKEGIQTICNYINGNLKDISERVEKLADLANEYKNFTMLENGNEGNVKFVMIMDRIKKEQNSKEEIIIDEKD